MGKIVSVAGMELDNRPVREVLSQVGEQMDGGFLSIQEVSMQTIIGAQENSLVEQGLHKLTHSIISDIGILEAVGVNSLSRIHEIKNKDFFFGFMRQIEQKNKSILILADRQDALNQAHDYLLDMFPGLVFVGEELLQDESQQMETIINNINIVAPQVILSLLPSPKQELFVLEHRDKLQANIWYGIGELLQDMKHHPLLYFIRRKWSVRKLIKSMSEYNKKEV